MVVDTNIFLAGLLNADGGSAKIVLAFRDGEFALVISPEVFNEYVRVIHFFDKVPDEYAQCFAILESAGIIPGELSGRLQQTARFRNLLVHMYWKIDYGIVYDILHNSINDFRSFSRIIAGLL